MFTITGKPSVPLGGHGLGWANDDDAMMSEAATATIGMQIKFN